MALFVDFVDGIGGAEDRLAPQAEEVDVFVKIFILIVVDLAIRSVGTTLPIIATMDDGDAGLETDFGFGSRVKWWAWRTRRRAGRARTRAKRAQRRADRE